MRIGTLAPWLLAMTGCMSQAPSVGYTPSGMAGNAVFFVESRADQDRQYLVLCHPQRTPPCARVAPGTIRNTQELERWVETQEEARRRRRPEPRPRRTSTRRPRPRPQTPLVADDDDWTESSSVVGQPHPPTEGPPPTPAPGVGIVNLVTPGGWANVYDDGGHFLGQTPIQLRLRAGTQELSLRPFGQPPGDAEPVRIDVVSQETVTIVRRLSETPDVVGAQSTAEASQ